MTLKGITAAVAAAMIGVASASWAQGGGAGDSGPVTEPRRPSEGTQPQSPGASSTPERSAGGATTSGTTGSASSGGTAPRASCEGLVGEALQRCRAALPGSHAPGSSGAKGRYRA